MGEEWIASTSTALPLHDKPRVFDMPLICDPSERHIEMVITLKYFLRSCL
jgi:hypothetical protein